MGLKRILVFILIVGMAASVLTACSVSDEPDAQVQNPMVEYNSLEAIEEKMGYPMLELPEELGYHVVNMYIIGGNLVQIDYTDAEAGEEEDTAAEPGDVVVTLRKARGKEDISGMYGVSYEQEAFGSIPVQMGLYEEFRVAWFEHEGYSYSVTAAELDGAAFDDLIIAVIDAVKSAE